MLNLCSLCYGFDVSRPAYVSVVRLRCIVCLWFLGVLGSRLTPGSAFVCFVTVWEGHLTNKCQCAVQCDFFGHTTNLLSLHLPTCSPLYNVHPSTRRLTDLFFQVQFHLPIQTHTSPEKVTLKIYFMLIL